MKWQHSKSASSGPSSSIGIMKFNDSMSGPKLTPEAIIVVTVAFAILVIILKSFVF